MFIGPLVLILVALLVWLSVPRGKRAKGKDDTALLDWADRAGHHSAKYKSIREELRTERTLS